jgi:anti-anti-sigma regulatory factor
MIFSSGFQVAILPDWSLLLRGELDMADAEDFRKFRHLGSRWHAEVVLDLTDLTFLGSEGNKAIVRLAESACPHGLVLRWPTDNVRRVLEIVKIEDIAGIGVQQRADPGADDPLSQARPRPAGR